MVKCLPTMRETRVQSLGREDLLEKEMAVDFPGGASGKESACNAEDLGSTPGSGRSPGEGNGSHFGILAWRIPWTEKTYRLSMGLQRVRYD